jgi:NAD(P)-dependent dehydrogenase (short-subunit alcohol dehydrogenase family)
VRGWIGDQREAEEQERTIMPSDSKIAIVTGAASGLGRAMTLGLLRAGFDVAGVDRNAEGLTGTAREATTMGEAGTLYQIVSDLSDPATFDRIVATVLDRCGHIDVLVNNAGIGQSSVRMNQRTNPIRFWDVELEQWNRFLAVNATAPVMMTRAVLPHMMARKAGRIITVTTSLGTMVREGYLLYGASKAAAEAAMAVLSNDLRGTGVTSNVLVPGGVTDTPLVSDETGDRSKMLRPEIMVPPLLYLVSEAAAAVNGRRFVALDWDHVLPPEAAAEKAGVPIAWMGIARMPFVPA